MHVLVVEDDIPLGHAIELALTRQGYTVTWLRDGSSALHALRDHSAELVLLDLGLPGKDGMEVLKTARRHDIKTPVLIMTARDAVTARIQGLDAGADDYLVKPFHLDELIARVRSLGRRAHGLAANRIEVGSLAIDLNHGEVTHRGQPIELSRREFALLQSLMQQAGRIVRRESLEHSIYGLDPGISSSALEVLVHHLRRKLGFDTIRTVRGFGYMLPRDPA
ncbi:response regulator [Frateuria aurantia]